jgi:glycosyltransferase involved in cell wall biosynthesis
MWMGSRVVVVVPAYNEAPRIARVVRQMPPWIDAMVLVDDASNDDTTDAARAAGDRRLEVAAHGSNRGVGAAIATGYRRASAIAHAPRDVFVVMAGDAQMDPRDLPALVDPIALGQVFVFPAWLARCLWAVSLPGLRSPGQRRARSALPCPTASVDTPR